MNRNERHINDLYEQIQFAMDDREEMRQHYLALEVKHTALTAERGRYKAALATVIKKAKARADYHSNVLDNRSDWHEGAVTAYRHIAEFCEALSPATPSSEGRNSDAHLARRIRR